MIELVNYTLQTCSEKIESCKNPVKGVVEYINKFPTVEIRSEYVKHIVLVNIIHFLDENISFTFEDNSKKYENTIIQTFFEKVLEDENPLYKKGLVSIITQKMKEGIKIIVRKNFEDIYKILNKCKYIEFEDTYTNVKWKQYIDRCLYGLENIGEKGEWLKNFYINDIITCLMYSTYLNEDTEEMFVKIFGLMNEEDFLEWGEITYQIYNKRKFECIVL